MLMEVSGKPDNQENFQELDRLKRDASNAEPQSGPAAIGIDTKDQRGSGERQPERPDRVSIAQQPPTPSHEPAAQYEAHQTES